jgi:hypothetical protein
LRFAPPQRAPHAANAAILYESLAKARLIRGVTGAHAARILSDVRRLAELIVICFVLGGFTWPAVAQSPLAAPAGAAQPLPAAQPAQEPAAAPPADADTSGPFPTEPAALPAQPTNGGQAAVNPSAIATATTELHRTPERFGGLPSSESAPAAPARPRLNVGKAIGVTTMRVIKDDSSAGSTPPAPCEVQILHDKPAGKTREVATLNVDGAPAQDEDIMSLLRRKACEAGANTVLIKSMGKTRVEGVKVDHVEAAALIVGTPKPPVDPSPVPKTITVTPEGPAVPKTITVDPGASP